MSLKMVFLAEAIQQPSESGTLGSSDKHSLLRRLAVLVQKEMA